MKGRTGKTSAKLIPKPHGQLYIDTAGEKMIGKKHGGKVSGKKPKARADKLARGGRAAKKGFHPGGEKGKLHREMGVPEGQKIPAGKLAAATHSRDPEKRRDAIRAETMKSWHKG